MEPLYFGRRSSLFGCFHPGVSGQTRGAVVLAPPLLNEGIRAHFAFREVALGLSRLGYDVMRFDFRACGNSPGQLTDVRVEDWECDLRECVRELRELAAGTRVSVFAARFSAHVVCAVSEDIGWERAVFWDPVLEGSTWIERMVSVRQQLKDRRNIGEHDYLGERGGESFTRSMLGARKTDISADRIVAILTDETLPVEQSWECRRLEYNSGWEQSFTENLFSHQVIEEALKIFAE